MKNLFKLGFLALALSLSVVSCSEKKADGTDSTTMDSNSADTMMQDTMAKDTMMTDTAMKDTMSKM